MGQIQQPGKGRQIRDDYNVIHDLELTEVKYAKLEMWIAKNIGATLERHYPNRLWVVQVEIPQRMVIIMAPDLSREKGYYLPMGDSTIHQLQDRAKTAAGEILERHGVARDKRFNSEKLADLVRDFKEEVITSDSAPESIDGSGRVLKRGER